MELKHWQVKFKLGEVEREMSIDGDAVQSLADVKAHLKVNFPEAKFVSAQEGYGKPTEAAAVQESAGPK